MVNGTLVSFVDAIFVTYGHHTRDKEDYKSKYKKMSNHSLDLHCFLIC